MHRKGEPPIIMGSLEGMTFPANRYATPETSGLTPARGDLIVPPLAGMELGEPVPFVLVPHRGEKL